MKTRLSVMFALCTSLFFSGCATTYRAYDGEKRGPGNVAVLKTSHGGAFVAELNGKPPRLHGKKLLGTALLGGFALVAAKGAFASQVEVLPGSQALRVKYAEHTYTDGNTSHYLVSTTAMEGSVTLAAGHIYRINGFRQGQGWSAFVEDVTDPDFPRQVPWDSAPPSGVEHPLEKALSEGDSAENEIIVTLKDGSKQTVPNPKSEL